MRRRRWDKINQPSLALRTVSSHAICGGRQEMGAAASARARHMSRPITATLTDWSRIVLNRQGARYFLTVCVGSVIDLSVAMICANIANLSLTMSAIAGFAVATILSYFAFEFLVFKHEDAKFSPLRLAGSILSVAVSVGLRLAVIVALGKIVARSPISDAFVFCAAMVVSFAVNYTLIKALFEKSGRGRAQ